MPFRTKLIPNWQMDWGKVYSKATYPTREKHTVELFDIREFVKELKKKKMNEMMSGNLNSDDAFENPSKLVSSNPMFGANPFLLHQEPVGTDNNFNVDDLVKRIDAKIAELEEEERLEKEKPKTTENNSSEPESVKDTRVEQLPNSDNSEVSNTTNQDNTSINLEELSKENDNLYSDNTDDENFFDDFFSDDNE